jgi:cell division inhibitor SepF
MKVWLGLADEYDEFDDDVEDDGSQSQPELARPQEYTTPYGGQSAVRRVDREPDMERARGASRGSFDEMARSFADEGGPQEYEPPARPSYDRASDRPIAAVPAQPHVKMHIVEPRAFSEAQSIADKFKSGTPVIVNLTATDSELAKRLLDFSSGLTYGLEGHLQKVADKVFMLTPRNVDVSAEDRRRLKDRGLFGADG